MTQDEQAQELAYLIQERLRINCEHLSDEEEPTKMQIEQATREAEDTMKRMLE